MKTTSQIIILFIALLCFNSTVTFSQNKKEFIFSPAPTKWEAGELMKRPIVLCKREVDAKTAEKLNKKNPGQLESMEIYNKYYNDTMLYYFKKYYKGSKDIQLKTQAEVAEIFASQSNSVGVIISGKVDRDYVVNNMTKSQGTYSFQMVLPDKIEKKIEATKWMENLFKVNEMGNYAFIISFMNSTLNDADFVFVIEQMNNQLQNVTEGKPLPSYNYSNNNTAVKLKNLKLIFCPQIAEGEITKSDIEEVYKLPFEYFDSIADYEKFIVNQTPGYAYIMPVWCPALWGSSFALVDAGTGEVLSILSAGGVRVSVALKTATADKNMGPIEKDRYEKQHMVEVVRSKAKYELKTAHIKKFGKLAMEGEKE